MAFAFTDTGDALLYEESGSAVGLRAAAAVAGVLAFTFSLFFVDLLRHAGPLDSAARIGGVLVSALGVLAFWAFGGYCFHIALFVPRQQVRFDKATRRITRTARSPARGARAVQHGFGDVQRSEVVTNRSSDGDISHELVLTLASARPIRLGAFDSLDDASAQLQQIQQLLQPGAAALTTTNSPGTR